MHEKFERSQAILFSEINGKNIKNKVLMRDNGNAELNVHQEKFAQASDWASESASAFDKKRGQNQKCNPV